MRSCYDIEVIPSFLKWNFKPLTGKTSHFKLKVQLSMLRECVNEAYRELDKANYETYRLHCEVSSVIAPELLYPVLQRHHHLVSVHLDTLRYRIGYKYLKYGLRVDNQPGKKDAYINLGTFVNLTKFEIPKKVSNVFTY